MKKHAYMIIAHNQFEILLTTLRLLDHENNHFFIHIDKKSLQNFPILKLKESVQKSKIFFCKSISVNWGAYSLIQCELNLLKMATEGNYDYYHLLSGVDLPIKCCNEILDFFESKENIEFIHFESEKIQEKYLCRIKTYFLFQEKARNNAIYYYLDKIAKIFQNFFGINRLRSIDEELQFGSNWFSITHEFAQYIIKNESWIKAHFNYALCADELFIQTLIINSDYKNRLLPTAFNGNAENNLRYIDWERGNPYIFKLEDFNRLINSPCLFARKFDLTVDFEIVEKLENYLNKKSL